MLFSIRLFGRWLCRRRPRHGLHTVSGVYPCHYHSVVFRRGVARPIYLAVCPVPVSHRPARPPATRTNTLFDFLEIWAAKSKKVNGRKRVFLSPEARVCCLAQESRGIGPGGGRGKQTSKCGHICHVCTFVGLVSAVERERCMHRHTKRTDNQKLR